MQDAVVVLGGDFVRIQIVGKRDDPVEPAVVVVPEPGQVVEAVRTDRRSS
jgi:hypothetical protein